MAGVAVATASDFHPVVLSFLARVRDLKMECGTFA
jgi:hypothetical protein